MDKRLLDIINLVKHELDRDPASIIFAQLRQGLNLTRDEILKTSAYSDFLEVTNGARFGSIDLWSYENLKRSQFVLLDRQNTQGSLLAIGQVLYVPLILDTSNHSVYTFKQDEELDVPMKFLGEFDDFLNNYVFGKKYGEIIPDYETDEWILFLKSIGVIN